MLSYLDSSVTTSTMEASPNLDSIPKPSDEQLLLEKRLRRQTKNKLKKEELKRMKEEEKRRKLYEPKDQRVKVVNQSELATINKPQEILSSAIKVVNAAPAISPDDFPSLGSSKSKFRDRASKTGPNLVAIANNADRTTGTECTVITPVEEPKSITSTTTQSQKAVLNKDQLTKPKRKDPIQIDVLTALKKEVPKVQHERTAHSRKEPTTQRSGNLLDASNPERKKGKVREIPKVKKPSQLKRVILQERDAKRMPVKLIEVEACETEAPQNETSDNEVNEPSLVIDEPSEINRNFDSPINVLNPSTDISQEISQVQERNESDETVASPSSISHPKTSIHSRKFREYCDHSLSPELDALLSGLITDIVKFQDRAYFNDPIKAHAKRRFVLGFREAKKYLTLKKLKLLIFAPDLEKVKSEGGIYDLIEQLKEEASSQAVPYVFGLGRKNLKKLTNKSFKIQGISCIGILNYEGTQDNFIKIRDLLPSLRSNYESRLEHVQCQISTAENGSLCAPCPETEECKSEEVREKEADMQVVASFLTKLKELQ